MEKLKNCIKYLMLTMLTLCPLAGQSRVNPGDVNNDKSLDVTDVSALINVILGKGSAVTVPEACDVDKDGRVDVGDVDMLIYAVLRGQKAYPDVVVPDGSVAYTVEGVTFYMVPVEGGSFVMSGGGPNHVVTLSDYSIGLTKVTCGLWRAVMGSDAQNYLTDDQPVTFVSWRQCQHFIDNLNNMTGLQFHLPTDAQWEFAAKGGTRSQGYTYSGSNDVKAVAWTSSEVQQDIIQDAYRSVLEVGMKLPNELGLYDMSCLLPEWIWDTGRISYADEPATDPLYLEDLPSWGTVRDGIPVTNRRWRPITSEEFCGLRLAL